MATDPGIAAIDRVFDLVDGVVDKLDRVVNRTKRTEERLDGVKRAKRADLDTAPTVKVAPKKPVPASSSTALATRRPRFRVVEAIAAESGNTIFVVTNGTVRAECTTRELAEKILRGLEAAP